MQRSKYGKEENAFYIRCNERNGEMDGIQSLRNKRFYVFIYDELLNDFVGKWIDSPEFLRK